MILVVDLVGELKGSLVKQLVDEEFRYNIFKTVPPVCPHCLSEEVSGIEVMGADKEGI